MNKTILCSKNASIPCKINKKKYLWTPRIKRNENSQNAGIALLKRRIEKLEKKNKGFEEENK